MSSLEGGQPPQTPGHQWGQGEGEVLLRVADQNPFTADPDPPVPFNADPDPDPTSGSDLLDGHPSQPPGHHWGAGGGQGSTDLCHKLILPLCPD
jgi:hypothetical protein